MLKSLTVIVFMIFYLHSYSQIKFQEGYFLNNENEKINCLIKNRDWNKNPTEFRYKLSKQSETRKISIKEVKEFGIPGHWKYERVLVKMDTSLEDVDRFSINQNPEYKRVELFLKIILEGQATLYYFEGSKYRRFFYKTDDSSVEQLIYKKYKRGNKINVNSFYKEQLKIALSCEELSDKDYDVVGYYKSDLIRLFKKYYECKGREYLSYERRKKSKEFLNLTIRPGINVSSLSVVNHFYNSNYVYELGTKSNYRLGLEVEFILPFNRNKWGVIIELKFRHLNRNKKMEF